MKYKFHNPDNLTPEQVGEGYRIKSDVFHRELNEAHAAGKLIQWKFKDSETWQNKTDDFGEYQADCDYRVKSEEPWTLDNTSVNGFILAKGQEWRKTREPWKWDELPPTFRPFTTLDMITAGDQFQFHGKTEWLAIAEGGSDVGEKPKTSHKFRTRRPLPTPEIPWTEWHGGECPLNDEEVEEWEYKLRDGLVYKHNAPSARDWKQDGCYHDIIAYRVLQWKEKPYAAPPVKSPEVAELQEHFADPQLTYHQWRGEPRDQEAPPTDNDAWESLLRTNASLGREVSELKKQRDSLSSQLQGVITACHLQGYNVGEPLGEWLEKQFEDTRANLTELLCTNDDVSTAEVKS